MIDVLARCVVGIVAVVLGFAAVFVPTVARAATSTSSASAASVRSGLVSLDEMFRMADIGNGEILAARSTIASAEASVQAAVRPPLQVVVQPTITEDVPGGVGGLQQLSTGIVGQVTPGVRFARALASTDVSQTRGLARATTRDVRLRIVETYFALAAAQARISAADRNVTSANELVTAARVRERVGAIGSFEVLRATIESRRAQTEALQARASAKQQAIALGVLVGRPIDPTIVLALDALAPVPVRAPSDDDAAVALTRDPTSTQFRAALARANAQLDVARAERRPTISFGAGYLVQRAPRLGRTSSGPTASLGVSIPVVDFGTIAGAEREARANAAVARAQIAGRETQLRGAIESARGAIASSRTRLDFSNESLVQAERSVRIAQIGFRAGALGTLDVIAARTAATTARADRDQARADYAAALAKFDVLLGDPTAP